MSGVSIINLTRSKSSNVSTPIDFSEVSTTLIRALEDGARIRVVETSEKSIGVDTFEDFERVRLIIETPDITYRAATIDDVPAVARVHVESWQRSFAGIVPQDFLNKMSVEIRIEILRQRFI